MILSPLLREVWKRLGPLAPCVLLPLVLAAGCDTSSEWTDVVDDWYDPLYDVTPPIQDIVGDLPPYMDVVDPATTYPIPIRIKADSKQWQSLEDNPMSLETIDVEMTIAGQKFPHVGMELHGAFARKAPKLSYRFEFPEEAEAYLNLFGEGPERQRHFVLKASWNEPTWTRDLLTMYLVRRSGGFAPRFSHAELWINDQWRGLYLVVERIDRQWVQRQGLEDDEFNLYKAETNQANWKYKDNYMDGYELQIGDENQTEDLDELLYACSHTPPTDADFAESLEPIFELQDFVVMQVARSYAGDMDAYTKNYYLYHDQSVEVSPFRIISWDADATWGNYWDGNPIPADNPDWYGWDSFSPRLLKVPKWRAEYLALFRSLTEDEGLAQEMEAVAREATGRIRHVAQRDLDRWQRKLSFDEEVERLLEAIPTRHQTMYDAVSDLK